MIHRVHGTYWTQRRLGSVIMSDDKQYYGRNRCWLGFWILFVVLDARLQRTLRNKTGPHISIGFIRETVFCMEIQKWIPLRCEYLFCSRMSCCNLICNCVCAWVWLSVKSGSTFFISGGDMVPKWKHFICSTSNLSVGENKFVTSVLWLNEKRQILQNTTSRPLRHRSGIPNTISIIKIRLINSS